ncbi:uncharacterized protein [Palaemon carinicauda]|uniref:uncharacterized protein n=1 Tax=Palaemon carinicauda TaxID=392227 RepID=UPI0035B5CC33
MIEDLNGELRNVGMIMNKSKTKIKFNKNAETTNKVMDGPIEIVDEYTYIGQTLIVSPGHETEIKRRMNTRWRALEKEKEIMQVYGCVYTKRVEFSQVKNVI